MGPRPLTSKTRKRGEKGRWLLISWYSSILFTTQEIHLQRLRDQIISLGVQPDTEGNG